MLAHYSTPKNSTWQNQAHITTGRVRVQAVSVQDKGGVDFWLWVCKGPTDDWPVAVAYCPAYGAVSLDLRDYPQDLEGLYLCASSDPVTKTPLTTNPAFFRVSYEPRR